MDGYLRLTIAEFNSLRFTHCWSAEDDEVRAELRAAGLDSRSSGYTEWMGMFKDERISLGWSWYESNAMHFEMVPPELGAIGTNLMLMRESREDLGPGITNDFLRTRIAVMQWQASVQSSIRGD
ncbi:DUF4902 domain-containing protein [Paraburkholderia humisilvae]|nr:DUF4902 domain-containing protein [Paraburkholderia humisilvae]